MAFDLAHVGILGRTVAVAWLVVEWAIQRLWREEIRSMRQPIWKDSPRALTLGSPYCAVPKLTKSKKFS